MLLASFRAIKQLPIGNHRQDCITVLHVAEACGYLGRPVLPQIDAHMGVEHITDGHCYLYRPLRRCGCGSLRFLENMSAGNSASKSRTRTMSPAFSRKTISSPRRKISTSELLTLNFLGSLTAWLFPDLNTRAVAMCHLLLNIYITVYTCASRFSRYARDCHLALRPCLIAPPSLTNL